MNIDAINEVPLLTAKEEKSLARSIIDGLANKNESRDKLFNSNLRLVFKCTSKYNKTYGISSDDLFGEACIGLMNAVDKFNPFKYKTKFSTYAYLWITRHLNIAVMDMNSRVYVPNNVGLKKSQYDKIMKNNHDIARIDLKKELKLSEEKLSQVENFKAQVFSIDQPAMAIDEDDFSAIDRLADDKVNSPDVEAISNDNMTAIHKIIKDKLTPDEQMVIRARYMEEDKQNLDTLAKTIGVTKQRVNQMEIKALAKMKMSIRKLGIR